MRKLLLAYQISGQTVGINISTWNITDLNGNQPFKVILSGQTIPAGYTDISSIVNWNTFACTIVNDYLVCKNVIKELVIAKGWSNLTNTEKDLAIQYYAYPDTTSAVIYLMGKGYTQQQAQGFVLLQWHRHHGNVMNSCKQRWYYVKFIVPQYLSFNDAEDLLNTVEPLVFAYNDMGRLGVNYGDKRDGIMDYIESTNMFQGQGLRENGYTLLQGTYDDFILAMKNVFVEGIYSKYVDIDIN
jgi:hypothetical protein